jgi:hypothetical protein
MLDEIAVSRFVFRPARRWVDPGPIFALARSPLAAK